MLKKLYFVFLALTIILGLYGFITNNFELNFLMLFFMGLAMLIWGLREFQQGRKVSGCLFIGVFLFSLFVSIQGFLLN
ncbi:DUF3953 domain-containing protein [Lysinibacillus sp. NPDC086135]|uniref:DUF3953 domain-containing protein n=1 Tax=Lysinibacillus sp. NPDC086135 TaxID=3364130 RepID=UPI0037F11682